MGRKASPRIWRDWYVTEAGGKGIHKLCLVSEGADKAGDVLEQYLDGLKKEREGARSAGLVESDTPYTVAQLAAEFLQLKEATKKQATFTFYSNYLQRLVEWYGHYEGRKVGFTLAAEYITRLKKLGLGTTSINHYVRAAKAVFNYAVEAERLIKNPWRKVELPPEGRRKRIVTEEEFAKLLQACDKCIAYRGKVTREENAQLMRDILHILRFTALRPGELRKLRWDHIKWEEDLIVIPASEQKTGTTAKEPEDRMIPILDQAKTILLTRRDSHGQHDRVFPNILGKEWTDQLFSRRFARLRERAGLDVPDHNGEMLVPYSLRHTRLTEAGTKEGWEFYTLMKLAGHTTSQMTKRYVHPGKEDLKRAAREGAKKRLASAEQEKPGQGVEKHAERSPASNPSGPAASSA
jgi:integrase